MSRPRILVVDDSEITLEVVRRHLEAAGCEVTTLTSALRLNAAIQSQRPELILLDVGMPGLAGDKAAAILKRHRCSREIPVVLHSAIDRAQLKRLAAETGATGYIRKTADGKQLVNQVVHWLARSRRFQTELGSPN